jgi:hypothetical protein
MYVRRNGVRGFARDMEARLIFEGGGTFRGVDVLLHVKGHQMLTAMAGRMRSPPLNNAFSMMELQYWSSSAQREYATIREMAAVRVRVL